MIFISNRKMEILIDKFVALQDRVTVLEKHNNFSFWNFGKPMPKREYIPLDDIVLAIVEFLGIKGEVLPKKFSFKKKPQKGGK